MGDETHLAELLYGPPGTGKTFLAKAISRALTQDESDVEAGEQAATAAVAE